MKISKNKVLFLFLLLIGLLIAACDSPDNVTPSADDNIVPTVAAPAIDHAEEVEEVEDHETDHIGESAKNNEDDETDHGDNDSHTEVEPFNTSESIINVSIFNSAGFVSDPTTVDCVLTDGTETQCAQFVTKHLPDNFKIGPGCPETLAEVGGIWYWKGDNPGLYQLKESFWRMLSEQGYIFYDDAGNINIEDPGPEGPNAVLEGNNCIEIAEDETAELTILIPLQPVMAESTTQLGITGQVGLALSSIPIFSDAPPVSVTNNMPALDPCGGHMDPGGWYHWHAAATDIESVYQQAGMDADCHLEQSAGGIFAYAYDGFPIYGSAESDGTLAVELDGCNGHVAPTAEYPEGIYHYHAPLDFPNLPSCLVGLRAETAIATNGDTAIPGGNGGPPGGGGREDGPPGGGRGEGGPPGGGGPPNFAAIADTLGISEQALRDAVGGPPPNLEAAAETLGISVEELGSAFEAAGAGQP